MEVDTLEIFLLIVGDKHLSKDLVVEEAVFYPLEDLYQTFLIQVQLLLEYLLKQVFPKILLQLVFLLV